MLLRRRLYGLPALRFRQSLCLRRQFFDRSFFICHTPSLTGKQITFLVSGPLSRLPELRLVYEAWVEFQSSHLVGFLSRRHIDVDSANAVSQGQQAGHGGEGSEYDRPQTISGTVGNNFPNGCTGFILDYLRQAGL